MQAQPRKKRITIPGLQDRAMHKSSLLVAEITTGKVKMLLQLTFFFGGLMVMNCSNRIYAQKKFGTESAELFASKYAPKRLGAKDNVFKFKPPKPLEYKAVKPLINPCSSFFGSIT